MQETTALIISNEEMRDIMKIVKSLEDFGLIIKGVAKTIQNKVKEQKCRFLDMLLGTLVANLLGNMLAEKGATRAGFDNQGDGLIRAVYVSKGEF